MFDSDIKANVFYLLPIFGIILFSGYSFHYRLYGETISEEDFDFAKLTKAGSSTMTEFFDRLTPLRGNKVGGRTLFRDTIKERFFNLPRNKEELAKMMSDSRTVNATDVFAFTVVRHPFERLVSAYFQLLRHWKADNVTRPLCRRDPKTNAIVDTDPSTSPTGICRRFLRGEELMFRNAHFLPLHRSCDHCAFDYDAVLTVDKLDEDLEFVAGALDIKEWQNKTIHANARDASSIKADKEMFFSCISKKLMMDLYMYYRKDFEMFGYTPDKYFKIVQRLEAQ